MKLPLLAFIVMAATVALVYLSGKLEQPLMSAFTIMTGTIVFCYILLKVANTQIVDQYKILSEKYKLKLDGNKSMGILKDPYVTGTYQGKEIFIGSHSTVAYSSLNVGNIQAISKTFVTVTNNKRTNLKFVLKRIPKVKIDEHLFESEDKALLVDAFLRSFEIQTDSKEELSKHLGLPFIKGLLKLDKDCMIIYDGEQIVFHNRMDMITSDEKRAQIEAAIPVLCNFE